MCLGGRVGSALALLALGIDPYITMLPSSTASRHSSTRLCLSVVWELSQADIPFSGICFTMSEVLGGVESSQGCETTAHTLILIRISTSASTHGVYNVYLPELSVKQ